MPDIKTTKIIKTKYLMLLLIGGLFYTSSSCTHQAVIKESPAISYSSDISPLIIGNCTQSNCHSANGRRFPLTTYSEVMNEVTAGNAKNSNIYSVIKDKSMPPSKPMADADVQKIFLWIMQGAKNN